MIFGQELNEMQAVCDAATQGPWTAQATSDMVCYVHDGDVVILSNAKEEDAEFCAKARTAMPRLIAELCGIYDLRPDVKTFAAAMEEILKSHDDRPGWEDEGINYLMKRLREERLEVDYLMNTLFGNIPIPEWKEKVMHELIDEANLCMMLYCNLKRSIEQKCFSPSGNSGN